MDLRGLTPQDVYQLMGSGLGASQLASQERLAQQRLEQASAQAEVDAYIQAQKLRQAAAAEQRLANKDLREASSQGYREVERDGKRYGVTLNSMGQPVSEELLGPAKRQFNIFKDTATGQLRYIPEGADIPQGFERAGVPTEGRTEMTPQQKYEQQKDLVSMDQAIQSGASGKVKLDDTARQEYAKLYNQLSPDSRYASIQVPGRLWGSSTQFIKLPKDPIAAKPQLTEMLKMKPASVVATDSKTGQPVTIQAIIEHAKKINRTPEEVLNYMLGGQ